MMIQSEWYPRCSIPFQNMVIAADGSVTPCPYIICDPTIPNVMGNVNESTILEVWNGEHYQKLRKFLYSEKGMSGCRGCLNMQQNEESTPTVPCTKHVPDWQNTEAWQNYLQFKEDIAERRTELRAKPMVVSYTESHSCNFRCIMCYQSYIREKQLKNPEKTRKEFFELLPYMAQLTAGGGEPFIQQTWKQLIDTYHGQYPLLTFATTTNGSYVTPSILRNLLQFNRVILNFSYDGSYKELFERIRIYSDFDVVYRNLIYAIEQMRQNGEERLQATASMTVMKVNFFDIIDMLRFMMQERFIINFSGLVIFPLSLSLCSFHNVPDELPSFVAYKKKLLEFMAINEIEEDFFQTAKAQIKSFLDRIPDDLLTEKHYSIRGNVNCYYYQQLIQTENASLMQIAFARIMKGGAIGEAYWYAPVDLDGNFQACLPGGEFATYLGQRDKGAAPTRDYITVRVIPSFLFVPPVAIIRTAPLLIVVKRSIKRFINNIKRICTAGSSI